VTLRYVVRPQADRDIDNIADGLAENASLDTALQFLAELYETFGLLADQKHLGWPCKVRHPQLVNARTFRVSSRFEKYLVFYQPYDERIEILRVVHGARDITALLEEEPL
jgi:toxin ParE1/3/4